MTEKAENDAIETAEAKTAEAKTAEAKTTEKGKGKKKSVVSIANDQYLTKHTGTIHVSNSLSLLERKMFNSLLMNTIVNGKADDKFYYISLADLKESVGYNHKSYSEVKEGIDKLLTTKIEWNIFGKDNKGKLVWDSATTFLSGRNFSEAKGVLKYSFSSELKEVIFATKYLCKAKSFDTKHL